MDKYMDNSKALVVRLNDHHQINVQLPIQQPKFNQRPLKGLKNDLRVKIPYTKGQKVNIYV
jgi:hypothetical protein